MATKPDNEDDDTLELTDEDELKPGPDDESDEGVDELGEDDEEGPASVGFADEDTDAADDNSAIRRLRQQVKEERQGRLAAERKNAPATIEIGEKPTMESCGWDADTFEEELDGWKSRKAAADQHQSKQDEENRQINEAWQQDLASFETKKGGLEFEDKDDAIETAKLSFDLVQQAVIVKAATDAPLFLYALSKSDAKRDELAKIHDPIKMAAAVARMEGAVKVTKGRKAPAPDKAQSGSASMPGGTDKQLEKLEAEADKTGVRTKVIAYNRKLKAAEKK